MKKLFVIIISLIILFNSSSIVWASNLTWTSTKEIELQEGQNQFNVEITIDEPRAYAGAEFGVQTPEGVNVRSVTYTKNGSKVAPTDARGLTWFSYYSGANDFSGKVTATLTLEYKGNQNTSLVIDNISVYTKDATAVNTTKVTPRKVIEIIREGAINPIEPLEPSNNSTLNPISEFKDTNNSSSNTNSNLNSKGKESSINVSTTSIASTTSKSVTRSNQDDINKNNSDNSDDLNEKVKESNNILETVDENANKIQIERLNTLILLVLIISIVVNAVIGYFYIKNKKKEK